MTTMMARPTTARRFSRKTSRIRRNAPPWETTSPPAAGPRSEAISCSGATVPLTTSVGGSSPTRPGGPSRSRSPDSGIADPRVHDGVEDVGEEIPSDGGDGGDEGGAEQHGDVEAIGSVDRELAHTREIEDGFGDHCPRNDGA